MSTPLARAEEAMQEAKQELKDAKAAYTEDYLLRKNPTASKTDLLNYLKVQLKEYNDNLQRKEEIYQSLLNQQQPQQGILIGMGG